MIEHKNLKPMWRTRHKDNDEADQNPSQMMKDHGKKILEEVKFAIDSIDNFPSVSEHFNDMGYKHYKFGARAEHFQVS